MLHDKLQNAFAHIEPSGDFANRTLDRMDTGRPENIAVSKRRLAVLGLATIFCLTVAVGLPFLLNARRAAVIAPGASQSIVSRWPRPTGPVAFADLDLPPADGLDFSDETFGPGSYVIMCGMSPYYTKDMTGAELAIKGRVEKVRFNHYECDEKGQSASMDFNDPNIRLQDDTLVYEIRVQKVFGARQSAADVRAGDLITTENLLYSIQASELAQSYRRMQEGHEYILMIGKQSIQVSNEQGGLTHNRFFTKESPYFLSGSLETLPMIELTRDGGYLFFAGDTSEEAFGWSDLLSEDTVHVNMPDAADLILQEHMHLRYGPGFEEDFQKLVDRNLLLKEE